MRLWLARAGLPWRLVPNDLPHCAVVHSNFGAGGDTGFFKAMVSDIRSIVRAGQRSQDQPCHQLGWPHAARHSSPSFWQRQQRPETYGPSFPVFGVTLWVTTRELSKP
jgi:hypothetical protein